MRFLAKTLLVFAFLSCAPAFAQEEPPARVGRVSLVSGTLAFYGPGDTDWSSAKVNLPVAAGAWLMTDPQSRAEMRVGADSINLSNDTQLNFAELRDQVMQIGLTQGRIDLHLRRLKKDQRAQIDVPRGGLWLLQPGVYDIDSGHPDQPTRITVFEGSARFAGGGIDTLVNAGEMLVVSGSDTLSAAVERAAPDEFVRWCRSHDYDEKRLAAPHHVSPAMTGYEELDAYGEWATVPTYGEVWFPTSVPGGWVPYREGRWVWIEPWGWNWVDDEPWGFAPCHYGRWARLDDRWAWVPGEFAPEPVYAPALVAFIPTPAIAVPVPIPVAAGPPVGWFPLAPGEVYWPAYTRNLTYIPNAAADRQPAIRKPSRGNCGAGAGSRRVRPGGTGSGCGAAAGTSPGRCRHNTAGSATTGRDGANRSIADFSTCIAPLRACNAACCQRCHGADTAAILERRSVQTHSAGPDASAGRAKFLTARPSAARQPPAGGLAETPGNTA